MCISTFVYMDIKVLAAVDLGIVHCGKTYVLQDGQISPIRSAQEVFMYRYTTVLVDNPTFGWVRLTERGSSMYTDRLAKGNEAMRVCVSRDSIPLPLGSVEPSSRLSESQANYLFDDAKTVRANSIDQVVPGLWYRSDSGTETAWATDREEEVRVARLPLPMSILTATEVMSMNKGNGKSAMLSAKAWQTLYKVMKDMKISLSDVYIGRTMPWVTGTEDKLILASDYAAINPYRIILEHEFQGVKNPWESNLATWGLGWMLQDEITSIINAANGMLPAAPLNVLY